MTKTVCNKEDVLTQNKELVQHFCKMLWEHRNLEAIDDCFVVDAKIFSPFNVKYGTLTMREIAEKWLTAFPDLIIKWQDFIAEGNKVVVRWRANGTHLGSFFETSPTHHEVYYSGITIFTVENANISEYWSLVDIHSILKQLGLDSLSEAID